MLDTPLVIASNLSKRFDIYQNPAHRLWDFAVPKNKSKSSEFWALKNVSFTISKGETIGIVGRNGSGKSTLLQLVCSILRPTEGDVKVFGRVAALLELGSGFNAQFTGRENIFLYATILGMNRFEVQSRFVEIIKFADIGRFIDYPLSTYSSGMIVRLAFATAIHMSPDLLVVDEALAVGDTAFQQKCLMRIRKMQADGVSILLVTHSSNSVIEFCDRALYLQHGSLIADGPTTEIIKLYSSDLVDQEMRDVVHANRIEQAEKPIALTKIEPQTENVRSVEITAVELRNSENRPNSVYNFGETITIVVKIVSRQDIQLPCCGIQLSSTDGIILWSCTTQSSDFRFPPIIAGEAELQWKINANFSGNRYVLSIGIGAIVSGEYKRLDRLEYAAHFDVLPQPRSGSGWLAPSASFVANLP